GVGDDGLALRQRCLRNSLLLRGLLFYSFLFRGFLFRDSVGVHVIGVGGRRLGDLLRRCRLRLRIPVGFHRGGNWILRVVLFPIQHVLTLFLISIYSPLGLVESAPTLLASLAIRIVDRASIRHFGRLREIRSAAT